MLGGREPVVQPATIHIEGNIIRKVGPADDAGVTHDLGDRVIAPAFINAHTHLSMGAFRGLMGSQDLEGNVVEDLFFRLERSLSPEDIRAFTRLGAYESLMHGVGLVWDHYYAGVACAEAIADVGLTAVVAPTLQDLAGPGHEVWREQLDATLELAGWSDQGVFAGLGAHATDTVSEVLWRKVAALSAEHQLPIHAHVAQSVEEYERIQSQHGCSPIEWLGRCGVLDDASRLLAVHAIFVDDADLARLDPTRHALAYCPLSQQQFCFPAHVPSWERAGLPWVVGTDCSISNDAMNVQRELLNVVGLRGYAVSHSPAYAAFRSGGSLESARRVDELRKQELEQAGYATPAHLLSRVWSVPGALHPAFTAGVIADGALANLIVLDPNHPNLWPTQDVLRALALSDVPPAIDSMMVRGRWIGTPGAFRETALGTPYHDARTEAHERLRAVLARPSLG